MPAAPTQDTDPNQHGALYQQALDLYERGDPAAAPLLEQVLAASPGHVEARYKLANLRKEAGELGAAAAHYREVLRLEPTHAEALNNLGAVHQMQGDAGAAESCYRAAIARKPQLDQPYANLGRLLQSLDRSAEAVRVFAEAQSRGLNAGLFSHLLAAASGAGAAGAASPRAPEDYVRHTFDAFAAGFEQRLVGELGYVVPARLVALALGTDGAPATTPGRPLDVLDLGCGTGLVGDALAARMPGMMERSVALTGVDLSPSMLAEARRKGRYRKLPIADIETWLAAADAGSFDLVVAADVFIYLGELDSVFRDVARILRAPGKFSFSVETCPGQSYRLLPSGRYAQADAYVSLLAVRHGFAMLAREDADIRRGVPGALHLLAKI